MSYVPGGPWTITKRLQYIEEATFGTTPTASPTFTSAGVIKDVRENTAFAVNKYRQQGSELVYKALLTGKLYSFEVTYQPISSALIKYCTQAASGTGTIAKSLSFVLSEDINDTEYFKFYKGAKSDRVVIEVTPNAVQVTQNFICRQITVPVSTANGGLTTPTFASADSTAPWVGSDGQANPLTINSLNYDTDRFRIEVDRHLDAIQPNGSQFIEFLTATNKDVMGDFDTLRKDTVLLTDCDAQTARSATYDLSSAVTATFTNFRLMDRSYSSPSDSNKVPRDAFKYMADDISLN